MQCSSVQQSPRHFHTHDKSTLSRAALPTHTDHDMSVALGRLTLSFRECCSRCRFQPYDCVIITSWSLHGSSDQQQQQWQTYTHPFNGPLSGTTQVSQYQRGKTNLDFTEARDSEWQWHQLGHMQVCTSLQTDNHASTPPLSFLQAGCPSCRPTNSVKALKTVNGRQYKVLILNAGNRLITTSTVKVTTCQRQSWALPVTENDYYNDY